MIGEHACAPSKATEISEEASAGSDTGKGECVLSAAPVSSPDIGLAEPKGQANCVCVKSLGGGS